MAAVLTAVLPAIHCLTWVLLARSVDTGAKGEILFQALYDNRLRLNFGHVVIPTVPGGPFGTPHRLSALSVAEPLYRNENGYIWCSASKPTVLELAHVTPKNPSLLYP